MNLTILTKCHSRTSCCVCVCVWLLRAKELLTFTTWTLYEYVGKLLVLHYSVHRQNCWPVLWLACCVAVSECSRSHCPLSLWLSHPWCTPFYVHLIINVHIYYCVVSPWYHSPLPWFNSLHQTIAIMHSECSQTIFVWILYMAASQDAPLILCLACHMFCVSHSLAVGALWNKPNSLFTVGCLLCLLRNSIEILCASQWPQ